MKSGTEQYEDIIDLPRPVSRRHAPMSRENRAAQFAPFAALSGHDAAVREAARLNEELVRHQVEHIQVTERR
ncbi:MAG: hypothetical protein IJV04_04745 [Lachnospiraceae bacterium]|nr:hypothetical protein [Lachnospiraceae bacterium]